MGIRVGVIVAREVGVHVEHARTTGVELSVVAWDRPPPGEAHPVKQGLKSRLVHFCSSFLVHRARHETGSPPSGFI
jgi:hypothetical protein